jgi:hypothetical protein
MDFIMIPLLDNVKLNSPLPSGFPSLSREGTLFRMKSGGELDWIWSIKQIINAKKMPKYGCS